MKIREREREREKVTHAKPETIRSHTSYSRARVAKML